jgi:hypothetical protein
MVKADVRRDYYADLGLQPSAEAEDVKKQFRKLGEPMNKLRESLWKHSANQNESAQVPSRPEPRTRSRIQREIPSHPSCKRDPQRPPATAKIRHRSFARRLRQVLRTPEGQYSTKNTTVCMGSPNAHFFGPSSSRLDTPKTADWTISRCSTVCVACACRSATMAETAG